MPIQSDPSRPSVTRAVVDPRNRLRQLLVDPETFASTLLILLLDRYGLEALQWHPTAIKMQLQSDFGAEMPALSLDRLMAAVVIVTTDSFFKHISKFNDICNVLAGTPIDPEVFDPADPWEMAWAITEALLLWPPDEDEPFSDDIRYYIGFCLREHGFITPPDVLRIALDGNFAEQVRFNFADDEEMFQAAYESQADKTTEVEQMIRTNLTALIGQIEGLPLRSGQAQSIAGRLRQEMRRAREGPSREEQLSQI